MAMAAAGTQRSAEAFRGWDGSLAGARALQAELANRVQLSDGYRGTLRTVAGFSAAPGAGEDTVRAACVMLDTGTLQPLCSEVREVRGRLPYVSELLGFRVLPAMLETLSALPHEPDLAIVEAHGIAHPRRFGLASHFGLASGLPTIGVARDRLVGSYPEPGTVRGDATPLRDGDQQVGWAVRMRSGSPPVFVSPGHRVSLAGALDLSLRLQAKHRLPEPVHLARRVASLQGEWTMPRRRSHLSNLEPSRPA